MWLFLRIVHIVTGVFWAGTLFFTVSYLMPTFREVGPDGAKVMAALRNRGMFNAVPMIALIAIASGLWMYKIRMGGGADWARTREAMTLGTGAITAILAVTIGWFGMRANTFKASDLAAAAAAMPAGAERDAAMAKVTAFRGKAMMAGRMVATLLLITVVTMAIARYI
jgi:hypothetical protein